jgi:uncharacterized integral membrane protein (TIGR00698 family)
MISPQWALALGIALSFIIVKYPSLQLKAKVTGAKLLQISIVLLGSSLNFSSVLKQGASGALITFISISLVFCFGVIGMKLLKIDKKLGLLITMGTAICGGSAIGALAPVLAAESVVITISIAIVFILNALAVFIFPPLGALLHLSQSDFGLWSALAIHDTSSVVAASSIYGQEALAVATTIKLTRALWIIPITVIFGFIERKKDNVISFPWFVLGFLAMSLAFTFIGPLEEYKTLFQMISKTGFAITLFLIGLSFDLNKIRKVGSKPFIFGFGLWILVIATSLLYITKGFAN